MASGTDELAALLGGLREADAKARFVEIRHSPLLTESVRIEGEFVREEGRFIRRVDSPYVETTTVTDDRVVLERAGRRPRAFKLARAPELAGIIGSFQALLGRDAGALQEQFETAVDREDDRWRLALTPRDPKLAAKLPRLELYGAEEPHCMRYADSEGGTSLTLIGPAAVKAAELESTAMLDALCERGR